MKINLFRRTSAPRFLRGPLSSLLLYWFAVSLLFSCQPAAEEIQLNFGFSQDDSNVSQQIVEQFNKVHKGKIRINAMQGSRISNQFYQQMEKDLMAEEPKMDIIGTDVIWTPALAANEWALDLSSRFYDIYNTEDFLEEALNSAIYGFRIWGIPWYTDAGMLFYRKDLLEKHGFKNPPRTYDELESIAKKIMEAENIANGYVFQGALHEGGVTNAVEFIWNAGGSVLIGDISISGSFEQEVIDPNIITINNERSKLGLYTARRLIEQGVSPQAVTTFRETECWEIFATGDAVFMRNWPSAYQSMLSSPNVRIQADQIGVALLPVNDLSMRSFSCLGGWNLVIRSGLSSEQQNAAWTFIKYMVAPEQQKRKAIEGGNLPTLKQLYSDPEVLQKVPVIALGREVMNHTRARPVSPYYMEISPLISQTFNQLLLGAIDDEQAVISLENELEDILVQHRKVVQSGATD